ncbi:Cbp4 [Tolypocladium paradoxum]|uniref:Cytochrome b mRNA-processing protein 4 n=1 Tax=Tolypocladium paradoxum TaxID=94208 RepID=A0A2S4KQV3_9HYPO|nr:Cbp4 [Tolypocladium paradoxum]
MTLCRVTASVNGLRGDQANRNRRSNAHAEPNANDAHPPRAATMPAKRPVNWRLWSKVLIGGAVVSVGGPALTYWLTPTEEQLRSRYNPDLLKQSVEKREEREQEFDEFVTRLKEYSKSDKPIWIVVKEEDERRKRAALEAGRVQQREADARRDEMRREAGLGTK